MSSKELKSLTGIRGIASIYVIIYHWYSVIAKNLEIGLPTLNNLLATFIGHGYLAVDLFFILSGFLLSMTSQHIFSKSVSIRDYKLFIYKRFSRLFPLYIVITLSYFVLFKANIVGLFVNLSLLQSIVHKYNNSIIPPGWSLSNEWIIYLFFPFLILSIKIINKKNWMLLVLSFLILFFIAVIRNEFMNWMNYEQLKNIHGFYSKISFSRGPASILRTIASYLLGIFAFQLYRKSKELPFTNYLSILLMVFLFYEGLDILIILLMPFLILFITKANYLNKFLSSKPVHYLGSISYSLYVNHYLFIKSYSGISNAAIANSKLISFLYVTMGTLLLSTLTYYAIEKPGMIFLKRRWPKHNLVS